MKYYLQKNVIWDVTAMLSQVKRYLLNDITDTNASTKMRCGCESVLRVDSKHVQIHVKEQ
jgi:hypothetical protein